MGTRKSVKITQCIDGVSMITKFNYAPVSASSTFQQPSVFPKPEEFISPDPEDLDMPSLAKIKPWLAGIIALVVFIVSSYILYSAWVGTKKTPSGQSITPAYTSSEREGKDETPISDSDINKYKVAPDLPRIIKIEKIGVKARILPMGVKPDNQLMAPENIYDTGWYSNSAKPGQKGAMLVDGHYSGPTRSGGIFNRLKVLTKGDIISIEKGDGSTVKYAVQKISSEPKYSVDMGQMMTPINGQDRGLNIITCDGQYDPKNKTYNNRTTVFATFVN